MSRPRNGENFGILSVRVPTPVLEDLDAWVGLRLLQGEAGVTRSTLIREVLEAALAPRRSMLQQYRQRAMEAHQTLAQAALSMVKGARS